MIIACNILVSADVLMFIQNSDSSLQKNISEPAKTCDMYDSRVVVTKIKLWFPKGKHSL